MSKKILIAVPCMDMVSARFASSLATLKKGVGDCIVSFIIGSLVYDSRNRLAEYAVRINADYILWLDSDMTFPPDVLERMMKVMDEHDDIDILTGLYFRRSTPFTPVAFEVLETDEKGELVFENMDEIPDGIREVAGCGFGCVLMKTDCLFDIAGQEGPVWFSPLANVGEDCAFCMRARKYGYKIYIDPSIEFGHMGYAAVTRGFYEATKGGQIDGTN